MEVFNREKFINATLFFAKSVKKLGITKLNKLLYYSDFEHFRLYGRPIIGDYYIRMEKGPVPNESYSIFNANFRNDQNDQDDSLKDAIYVRKDPDNKLGVIVAKRKFDSSLFSKSEIEIMQKVAFIWKDATAKTASKQSHLERPWKETARSEVIDYKLVIDKQSDSISREYAEYREREDLFLMEALGKS